MLAVPRLVPARAWLLGPLGRWVLDVEAWAEAPRAPGLNFFAPDFALNSSTPWMVGSAAATGPLNNVGLPSPSGAKAQPKLKHRAEASPAKFNRLHDSILARIGRGEFTKVVPVITEDLEFEAGLNTQYFPRAFEPAEHQFAYGFEFESEGLSGITPEVLFSFDGKTVYTMALAGTGPSAGPSLLDDPKELREHQVVIEHITEELKPWGEAEVGATIERHFGPLKHLYTPIYLVPKHTPSFMELVVKLHPTAALGGWPRRPAVEWLQAQDFHVSRARFGAPFGILDGQTFACVVAIRGIQWWGPRARLCVGCGVVEGSRADKEWNELQLKRRATLLNLGLEL